MDLEKRAKNLDLGDDSGRTESSPASQPQQRSNRSTQSNDKQLAQDIDEKRLTKSFTHQVRGPDYPAIEQDSIVKNGYEKNSVVYSCVNEVAESFNQAEPVIFRKNSEGDRTNLPNHQLRDLLKNPNPATSSYEFHYLTLVHLLLTGNAFWQKIRPKSAPRNGAPVELWPLNPLHVRVRTFDVDELESEQAKREARKNGYIKIYEYKVGDEWAQVAPRDIVHFRNPSPRTDEFGFPPLAAAMREIVSDNEGTDLITSMLQNSAIPGIAITTEIMNLDQDLLDRLKTQFKQNFGGDSRGEPAFLAEGMDIKDIAHSFRDMELPELRKMTEVRICANLGVPPIVAGFQFENTTYNNYDNARRSFWEETMEPKYQLFASKIESDLASEWNDDLKVTYDKSSIPALRGVRSEMHERARQSFNMGMITLNEARDMIGLDPLPGDTGDVISPPNSQILHPAEDQEDVISPPLNAGRGRPPEGGGESADTEDNRQSADDPEAGGSDSTQESSLDEEDLKKKSEIKIREDAEEGELRNEGETFSQCLSRTVPKLIQSGMDREEALKVAKQGCAVPMPWQDNEGENDNEQD